MGISDPPCRRPGVIAAVAGAVATVAAAQVMVPPSAHDGAGDDPAEFWTPERMRDARPLPLPAPPGHLPPASAPEADGASYGSPSGEPSTPEPN